MRSPIPVGRYRQNPRAHPSWSFSCMLVMFVVFWLRLLGLISATPSWPACRHTRHHELCNLFRIPTGRACRKALALLILIVVSAGGECRASLTHQLTVPVCRQAAVSDRCTNLLASSSRIRPAKSLANATAISSSCKDPKWYSSRAGGKRIRLGCIPAVAATTSPQRRVWPCACGNNGSAKRTID